MSKKKGEEEEELKCDKMPAQRNYYRYYDTPDGCHIEKKIGVTVRYGVIAGIIAGTYDVLMYSHVVGLVPILKRYARHVIPLGLMGATFAAVANGVQRYREIDDHLNYFLGGIACAPLVALYTGSPHGLVPGAILLGAAALIKKEAVEKNYSFVQPFPSHMNMVDSWRHDWTLAADPRDEMRHTCNYDFEAENAAAKEKAKQEREASAKKTSAGLPDVCKEK